MVMVIKSNVSGASISNPDGWNPPFSTDGLRYANIFGRGNITANYAPGGTAGVVYGNPVKNGESVEFSSGNYIDTRISTSENATLISIADISHPQATRNFLISCSESAASPGRSLVIEGATPPNIAVYSHYKGTDDTGAAFDGARSAWFKENDNSKLTAFLVARDLGNQLKIADLTNVRSTYATATGSVRSYAKPSLTYLIGTSRNIGSGKHLNFASLIYDRALSDDELTQVYNYFKGYFSRRGITI